MYGLLELDADINALNLPHEEKDQSAQAIVMYRSNAEIVENLLARGAEPTWSGSQAQNLIHTIKSNPNRQYRAFDLPRCVWSWFDHDSPQNRLDQLKRCLQAAQIKGVETDLRRNNSEHRWLTLLVLAIHVPA